MKKNQKVLASAVMLFFLIPVLLSGCSPPKQSDDTAAPAPWKPPVDELERYFYTHVLDDDARAVYNQIVDSIVTFRKESVKESSDLIQLTEPLPEEDFGFLSTFVTSDFPEFQGLFYVNGDSSSDGMVSEFRVKTFVTEKDRRDAILQKIDERVQKILAGLPENATDYQAAKYFHDTLVLSMVYSDDHPDGHRDDHIETYIPLYKSLVLGYGICGDYSLSFQYLCNQVNIPCFVLGGEANSGAHAWNLVKLGNEYYHVDVTWDDLGEWYDGSEQVRYNYFLLTDEEISRTHTVDMPYSIPRAQSNSAQLFPH
jgi:hypothetical protein